jgi:hypothetical protein
MRFVSVSIIRQACIIVLAAFVGAMAMYTWQASANKAENKSVATGSMPTFIQELHRRSHTDKLPVEVIEGYN